MMIVSARLKISTLSVALWGRCRNPVWVMVLQYRNQPENHSCKITNPSTRPLCGLLRANGRSTLRAILKNPFVVSLSNHERVFTSPTEFLGSIVKPNYRE
jgi:hypothetical protein